MKKSTVFILVLCSHLSVQASDFGPVTSSDTLWSIANNNKPKEQSVSEYLNKIFKANPHAFKNNNVNLIIEGSYLDLLKTPLIKNEKTDVIKSEINKDLTNSPNEVIINKTAPIVLAQMDTINLAVNSTASKTVNVASKTSAKTHNTLKPTKQKKSPKKRNSFLISYDISSSYDDNLRLAQNESDIRDDVIYHGIFKVSKSIRFGSLSKFKFGLSLEHNAHSTFSLLDNTKYNFNSLYLFSTDSSYSAPLYILKLDIGGIESESEMRKANTIKFAFNINKRISNKIVLTSGIQVQSNDSQSRVFDTKKMSIFVNADFSIDRRNLIYTTYHFIDGDIVSSSTPSLDVVDAASEIEADDAFGGTSSNQFAYKIDSTSHVFSLGFNHFTSRALSFDVSARYVMSESNENSSLSYERLIIRAGILGRF